MTMSGSKGPSAAYQGGCLCGAVRYEVSAEPVMTELCYCLSCRKLSGSGHSFDAMVPDGALELKGEVKSFAWPADSGNTVTSSFCPRCGSPLFARSTGYPGTVAVRVASLDDPSGLSPQMAVYTKRLLPWDHLDPALPAFEAMPPPAEL
jgi:hypothetical protein